MTLLVGSPPGEDVASAALALARRVPGAVVVDCDLRERALTLALALGLSGALRGARPPDGRWLVDRERLVDGVRVLPAGAPVKEPVARRAPGVASSCVRRP